MIRVAPGDTIPAGLTFSEMDVPANGQLKMRVCNPTAVNSVADSDIKVRWYAIR